jgi:hypothetical protein
MGEQIDAPVDRTAIHPAHDQPETNGRSLTHFCKFGTLLFVHFYFIEKGANRVFF